MSCHNTVFSKPAPNIARTGQVRALPSLEEIQRLRYFLFLAFICQFPHLPVTLAVKLFQRNTIEPIHSPHRPRCP